MVAEIPAYVDEYGQVRDLKSGSKLLSFKRQGSQLLRMMVLAPTHLPVVINLDPQKDPLKEEIIRFDLTSPHSKVLGYIAKLSDGISSVVIPAVKSFSSTTNIGVLIGGDATLQTDTFDFGPRLSFCVNDEDQRAILNRVGVDTPNAVVFGRYSEDLNFDGQVKNNGSGSDRVFLLWTRLIS